MIFISQNFQGFSTHLKTFEVELNCRAVRRTSKRYYSFRSVQSIIKIVNISKCSMLRSNKFVCKKASMFVMKLNRTEVFIVLPYFIWFSSESGYISLESL